MVNVLWLALFFYNIISVQCVKYYIMSKILILGGTGSMGKHLVSLLENTDNEVYVTTRGCYPNRKNITYIQGNAHDEVFISSLLQKRMDVIVDFMVYNTQEFAHRVHLLLKLCKQYVYLSSSRVYSDVDQIITEETPRLLEVCTDEVYLSTDEYALTKARQEDILKDSGKLNWTVIRPYITYSENRLQLGVNEKESWLYRALQGRTIVFSNDIAAKCTTLTYGQDVARGIMAVIGKEAAYGQAFHITSDECILWSEILELYVDIIGAVTGKKPKVLMRDLSPNLSGKSNLWQVKFDRYYNRRFDNSKIKQFLSTDDFVGPQIGLSKCLEAFLKNPTFEDINWRKEAQFDRWTNEVASPFSFNDLKQCVKYYLFRFCVPESNI